MANSEAVSKCDEVAGPMHGERAEFCNTKLVSRRIICAAAPLWASRIIFPACRRKSAEADFLSFRSLKISDPGLFPPETNRIGSSNRGVGSRDYASLHTRLEYITPSWLNGTQGTVLSTMASRKKNSTLSSITKSNIVWAMN